LNVPRKNWITNSLFYQTFKARKKAAYFNSTGMAHWYGAVVEKDAALPSGLEEIASCRLPDFADIHRRRLNFKAINDANRQRSAHRLSICDQTPTQIS